MKNIKNITDFLSEELSFYDKWKRANVTYRGIRNKSFSEEGNTDDNFAGGARFGIGLYTVPLSNKKMTREYGEVFFVVNGRPKNPKMVYDTNEAEIFIQKLVTDYCKNLNIPRNGNIFYENTDIKTEMLKLGYDGLFVKGREMVNYTPEDVKYFKTEEELYEYYRRFV